jgi:serine/threonine protein kinase
MQPGSTLGAYQILSRIGGGGMGDVYSAKDTRLDRMVAIKVLPNDVADDPERLSRLVREAKLLASLNHPNICTIYEINNRDGQPFIGRNTGSKVSGSAHGRIRDPRYCRSDR